MALCKRYFTLGRTTRQKTIYDFCSYNATTAGMGFHLGKCSADFPSDESKRNMPLKNPILWLGISKPLK